MLAQCLMKNRADRSTAERLLAHRLFVCWPQALNSTTTGCAGAVRRAGAVPDEEPCRPPQRGAPCSRTASSRGAPRATRRSWSYALNLEAIHALRRSCATCWRSA